MKVIPNFINNEKAVSFGYIALAAFLILATAIWINFQKIFNIFFVKYNVDIADGLVTSQNQAAMAFHQAVIAVVAIVMLIGVVAWGYIRALEKRNEP